MSINVAGLGVGLALPGKAPVSSLDFHREGECLISAAEDGTVQLVNALEGNAKKSVHCRKYGVELCRFTHHELSVLCTSRPPPSAAVGSVPAAQQHEVRYLSLYDNSYMRFFQGHTARVTGLSMSPTDDRFLTAAMDGTVRLWTLQQPKSLGVGTIPSAKGHPALVGFDSSGLVFAACAYLKDRHVIKLYDSRNFAQGAFSTYAMTDRDLQHRLRNQGLDQETAWTAARAAWTHLAFSADGSQMLVSTRAGATIVFDAFELLPLRLVTGYGNAGGLDVGACFTPDQKYVLTGSEGGEVCVFDNAEGSDARAGPVQRLKGHTAAVRQVVCNPKYEVLASACSSVVLWIPAV